MRRSYKLWNGQESSGALLANCIKDLDRKYGSYLNWSPVSVRIYTNMIIKNATFLNLLPQSKFYQKKDNKIMGTFKWPKI